jgi:hypothetical protein
MEKSPLKLFYIILSREKMSAKGHCANEFSHSAAA